MAGSEEGALLLSPDLVRGRYPVHGDTMDLLVAQVARQGMGSAEWGEWVGKKAMEAAKDAPEEVRGFLAALLETAEDLYVAARAEGQVWRSYLEKAWALEAEPLRDPALPPSPESLARVWRDRALFGRTPDNLHFLHDDLLPLLDHAAEQIPKTAALPNQTSRREARALLYSGLFVRICRALAEWERFLPGEDAVNLHDEAAPQGDLEEPLEDGEPETREPEEEEKERSKLPGELPQELAEDVAALMEDEEADLTRSIAVAVRDPEAGQMETVFRRGAAKTTVRPDPLQVRRLRRLFQEQETLIRQAKRRKVRRGLTGGVLDQRRLYRVPMDGRAFKHRQAPGKEHAWRIVVVADASASMSGRPGETKPWSAAEKCFVSLAEAAKGSRNLVDIYAYNEDRRVCGLTLLNHGGELHSVMPGGRTPSGQAIVAAAMRSRHRENRTLLIHITDGASNCGMRMGEAVRYCERNGIDIYTIGCGCNRQTRDFLREFFPPGRILFLKDIGRLAQGIERLFRNTILYSIQ
jgi:Mg-chelatase subunit ChlD